MPSPDASAPVHQRPSIGLSALSLALIGALSMTFGLTGSALAQTQLPPSANPGLLQPSPADIRPSGEELKQPDKAIPEPKVEETKIDIPEQPAVVQLQNTKFFVKSITVDGVSLFDPEAIRPIVAKYENQEVTLQDLSALVEEINQLYRNKGYLTTIAYIPPQDVDNGELSIQVVEGTIGKMEIVGHKYHRGFVVARSLDQRPGDVLNIRTLENNLNLSNFRNNFRMRATLSPGEETGETNVRMEVEEQQPWQIAGTYDNQGRTFIGTQRWGVEVANRNLLGMGDRLTARWIGASRTQSALGSYFLPLNKYGTEVGTTFGYSFVDVDLDQGGQPDIEGQAFNYGLVVSQPLDKRRTFVLDGGLNFRRIDSLINNTRTNRDDIVSLQTGLNFDKFDRLGRTFARAQWSIGAHWLGGNRDFMKYELFSTRLFRLPKGNLLVLRGYGQLTPSDLPPAELMQIGGAYSVRGYSEGLLTGERGYNFSAEHRWPIPFLRNVSPYLADRTQGVFFFDMGQVWVSEKNRQSFIPLNGIGPSNAERTLLASAGFGLRFQITRFFNAFVDCGFPLLNRERSEPLGRDYFPRVHFGLRSEMLPNDFRKRSDEVYELKSRKEGGKMVKKSQEEAISAPEETETAPTETQNQEQNNEPTLPLDSDPSES
ncbi:MAG: ShlB/FhaC/HecB family hemolysin secretion/activation protein [Candidatus Melainabacteria bacterium]|nr:ShlB/FhaC/HecB family hemolysin secretion/activation protein [Candidatus Melainabacteria bacterium]